MDDLTLSAADEARHDLVALALHIARARDAATADTAYHLARRRFYDVSDDVQIDEGVQFAWQQVLDSYAIKLDEFDTPTEPLVVLS